MAHDRRNISHLKLLFLLVKVILFVNLPSIVLTCDNNGMVTLMQGDGDSPLEGRVEVCVGGLTGSVCGYSWDNLDASVVCRQLGFSCSGASAKQLAIEASSTEDIVLFESICEGNETILTGCSHSLMPQPCDTVAGVVCLEASCNSGDARLVDGSSPLEGRVEVCVDQGNYTQWGSVCSPLESVTAAFIVCRQLHLADTSSDSVLTSRSSNFGPGTLPILLYNPRCMLSSRNLLDACTYNEIFGCHPDGVICPGTEHVSIVDAQPGISSIRLHWTLLNTMVSHYEVMCSRNKGPSLTYKTSVTVYGNTHNVIELEGLQPSSNYNCCVTAYRLQQDNGNQKFIVSDHSCVSVDISTVRNDSVDISTVRNEPFPPQDIVSSNTTCTAESAKISWSVPILASTQETYEVLYGVNSINENTSMAQLSQPGVQDYDVTLCNLLPSTRYMYSVRATNEHSSNSSRVKLFFTADVSPSTSKETSNSLTGPIAGTTAAIVILVLLLFISGSINVVLFLRQKKSVQWHPHKNIRQQQSVSEAVTWSNTEGVDIDTTTCEAYEVMKHKDQRGNRNEGGTQETAAVYEEVGGGSQNRGRLYVSGPTGRNTAASSATAVTQEYEEVGPTHHGQGGVAVSTEHAQNTGGAHGLQQEATYEVTQ